MWAIWKARNDTIFNNNNPSIQRIIPETHYWYSYSYSMPDYEDRPDIQNSFTTPIRVLVLGW